MAGAIKIGIKKKTFEMDIETVTEIRHLITPL
jgi:hypothetical protein